MRWGPEAPFDSSQNLLHDGMISNKYISPLLGLGLGVKQSMNQLRAQWVTPAMRGR